MNVLREEVDGWSEVSLIFTVRSECQQKVWEKPATPDGDN